MTLLLAALALAATLPFAAEALRRRVRPEEGPGQVAHLPQGDTHYRWSGPETGPVAVCVHGLSTPSYVFAATERSLAGQGYRVLTYDLYGRGHSARATGPQTETFFLRQLRALLFDQGVTQPVTLVGYSMGGIIASAYAASTPDQVRALILIAPAGFLPVYDGWRSRLWTAPVIGDWATRVLGGLALRRELVEHRSNATVIPDLEDRQAAETRTRGYLPALLSSRRHILARTADEAHRRIAAAGLPVLAIWGASDPVIPLAAMGRLAELNPEAHHAQIPGAGHVVLQTHPAQVAQAMRDFLEDL